MLAPGFGFVDRVEKLDHVFCRHVVEAFTSAFDLGLKG